MHLEKLSAPHQTHTGFLYHRGIYKFKGWYILRMHLPRQAVFVSVRMCMLFTTIRPCAHVLCV